MALLTRYDWPGNVRQLENAMFRAVVLCESDELTIADFPQLASQVDGFEIRIPTAAVLSPGQPQPTRTVREIVQVPVEDPNALKLVDASGDMRKLDEIERETIRFAIHTTADRCRRWRASSRSVARRFYRKLKDLGLDEGLAESGGEGWSPKKKRPDRGGVCSSLSIALKA